MSKDRIVVNEKLFVRCGRGLEPAIGGKPAEPNFLGFFNVVKNAVRLFDRMGNLRCVLSRDTLGIHEAHYMGEGRVRYFHGGSAMDAYAWLGYAFTGEGGNEYLMLGVEEEKELVRRVFAELEA